MKRRPLVYVFLSLTAGIILAEQLEIESPAIWSITGIFILLAILALLEYSEIEGGNVIALFAVLLLGAGLYGANYFQPGNLYHELNSLKKVRGEVVSYPINTDTGTELILKPDRYRGKLKVFLESSNSVKPGYGDEITVTGRFEAPAVFEGFNYREFLRKKDIWGIVYQGEVLEIRKSFGDFPLDLGWTVRKFISERITAILPGQGNFLKALLFGNRDVLNDSTRKNFMKTGLAHLLAASGLHLGIVLGVSWWLITKSGLTWETAYVISTPLVFCYLLVVGFDLPMSRASLIYLFGGAHLLFKKSGIILYNWYDIYQALAGAALVFVIINPETIFTAGFQLSFGATFALGLFFKPIKKNLPGDPKFLRETLAASLSAQIGVLPVLAVHFGYIYPWAPFINLIAIPGVTVIIYMGFLTLILGNGIFGLTALPLLTSKSIIFFQAIIEKISQVPLSRIHPPSTTPLTLISYFIIVYWFSRRLNTEEENPGIKRDR